MDEASAETLRGLITKGAAGWLGFYADDCRKTFEDLKDKGVEMVQEPTEQEYGIDFAVRDPVRQPDPDRAAQRLRPAASQPRRRSHTVTTTLPTA